MASQIFRDGLLAGKRAFVTGGGTGIGRSTALELACLGADVTVVGRRAEPIAAVRKEVEGLGRRSLAISLDIRDTGAVAGAVSRACEELGAIDILVNNAGGHFFQRAEMMSAKGWHAVVDTNLNGTFAVTQAVAKQAMIPQKSGVIVNIVLDMWQGTPGAAHAGAARAAVENLTRSLSVEWAEHGIRVNAIAPGTIDTGAVASYPPAIVDALRAVIPRGRFGRPDEIAWMIAFLASDAGDWISGETICIDGGARNHGGVASVFAKAAR